VNVPIKDNEGDRVPMKWESAKEKGKLLQEQAICPEILPFSTEQDLLTVLQGIGCTFDFQAFEIAFQYSC